MLQVVCVNEQLDMSMFPVPTVWSLGGSSVQAACWSLITSTSAKVLAAVLVPFLPGEGIRRRRWQSMAWHVLCFLCLICHLWHEDLMKKMSCFHIICFLPEMVVDRVFWKISLTCLHLLLAAWSFWSICFSLLLVQNGMIRFCCSSAPPFLIEV